VLFRKKPRLSSNVENVYSRSTMYIRFLSDTTTEHFDSCLYSTRFMIGRNAYCVDVRVASKQTTMCIVYTSVSFFIFRLPVDRLEVSTVAENYIRYGNGKWRYFYTVQLSLTVVNGSTSGYE